MGDIEEFNTLTFEKKLMQLKDTQESIQGLSSWCLRQRAHHKKIVQSWLNVLKRVKIEQRLVLFYLANDVIQYSKRKSYDFVESWGLNLQKATPLVRDDKVRPKILRIFKIWEQRSVYDDEFLSDLTGLLSAGAIKKTDDDPTLDFQPQQLVNKIKQCQVLETDTDQRLKNIHESHLELSDADALCTNLKDRSHKDDVEKELNEGIACVERYTQALQREIVAREALLALLTSANQYYSTQRGEVKVVAYAYKNFGARVRALKRKLDELTPSLPASAPSPPALDEDVPSPGPDEDIDLPPPNDTNDIDISYNIDRTFNTSFAADGSLYNLGLSSFLTADNPMGSLFGETNENINSSNKIEVINNRPEKPDFNINDFLKTFAPNDNAPASDNNSVTSGTLSQKSQDTLPGLDLLTPESAGNPPPPISFYGTMDQLNDEPDQPYHPESSWTSNNWSIPAPPAPPISLSGPLSLGLVLDTPESPPPAPVPPPAPPAAPAAPHYPSVQDLPSDVDHRGLLPPPPPPPVMPLLGHMEDVDHRLMPTLPSPPVPVTTASNRPTHQDVDHRNLISLTHQPLTIPPAPQPPIINLDQDYRLPPPSMQPPLQPPMQPPLMQPPPMQPPPMQPPPMQPPMQLPMTASMPPSMPLLLPPSDIVESVDMDLSEDEEQGMYHPDPRRQSFNNNKILVGGDNGKTQNNPNFIKINDKKDPNNYDGLPNPFHPNPPYQDQIENNLEDDEYLDDLRSRGIDDRPDYDQNNMDWQNRRPNNQRFPRNWSPRTNFNNRGFGPQFWPRNGPRPNARWMAPRPRFW